MIKQKKGGIPGQPPQLTVRQENGDMKTITDKNDLRLLGTNLQQNIIWNNHLEKAIFPSVRRQFGTLKTVSKMLPMESKKILAERLLISKMLYVISQWGGTGTSQITTAQRLLNKMARWISGMGRKTKTMDLLRKLGWLSMKEQIRLHSIVQMWKIINLNKPEPIREKIQVTDTNDIIIHPTRLQFSQNIFTNRAAHDWNQMPQDLKLNKNLPNCKRKLKTWIL